MGVGTSLVLLAVGAALALERLVVGRLADALLDLPRGLVDLARDLVVVHRRDLPLVRRTIATHSRRYPRPGARNRRRPRRPAASAHDHLLVAGGGCSLERDLDLTVAHGLAQDVSDDAEGDD